MRFDELVNVRMADHIYAGEWPIYFQEAWGHEPLYHYFHALGMSLLGKTVLGVRISSVLFGTVGVLTAYLLFRRLFGRAPAAIAALLQATSFWSLMYSRIGLRHISLPPWFCLSAYCFWQGLETPSRPRLRALLWFAVGGIASGLALYTYFASRVVPFLFVLFVAYLVAFRRDLLRGRWVGVILFLALPALIVTPMALYLRNHPELEQRLGQVGGELFAALRADDLGLLLTAILDTVKMFSIEGDPEWLYNISGRPVYDPLTSIAFAAGVATSAWRWRDPKRAFLLVWLGIGVSPSLLSWPPGSLGHTIVAQPAAMGVAALGLVDIWQWVSRRSMRWLSWGGRAAVLAIPITFVALNGYDYFWRWPRFVEVRHEYQAPVTAVARYLQQNPTPTDVCVSAPYVDHWNPWSKMNFDLYCGGIQAGVRWFDGRQSILFPASGDALFFLPDYLLLPSGLDDALEELLLPGVQPVVTGSAAFDLYRWTDRSGLEARLASIADVPVWASPETTTVAAGAGQERQPLDVPVRFGHLAFLGYAYAQDRASVGETWQMTTYWRVLTAESSPLAIFCHVLDDANQVRAGWDGLYVSPESWEAGDTFVHQHTLVLPADLLPGSYRIEVGVYSPVTLVRLPLYTGDTTAPYDRALLAPLHVE